MEEDGEIVVVVEEGNIYFPGDLQRFLMKRNCYLSVCTEEIYNDRKVTTVVTLLENSARNNSIVFRFLVLTFMLRKCQSLAF